MNERELFGTLLAFGCAAVAFLVSPAQIPGERTHSIAIQEAGDAARVVRERTPGRALARFVAAPRAITPGHWVRFAAHSEGRGERTERWSCVAFTDVEECLGRGVEVRYQPGDERVVLTVTTGLVLASEQPEDPEVRPALGDVAAAR